MGHILFSSRGHRPIFVQVSLQKGMFRVKLEIITVKFSSIEILVRVRTELLLASVKRKATLQLLGCVHPQGCGFFILSSPAQCSALYVNPHMQSVWQDTTELCCAIFIKYATQRVHVSIGEYASAKLGHPFEKQMQIFNALCCSKKNPTVFLLHALEHIFLALSDRVTGTSNCQTLIEIGRRLLLEKAAALERDVPKSALSPGISSDG